MVSVPRWGTPGVCQGNVDPPKSEGTQGIPFSTHWQPEEFKERASMGLSLHGFHHVPTAKADLGEHPVAAVLGCWCLLRSASLGALVLG